MEHVIFKDSSGKSYTETQVACAIQACAFLRDAYASGEESGSVDWEDVDQAHAIALEALHKSEVSFEFKKPEDTEGGSCD